METTDIIQDGVVVMICQIPSKIYTSMKDKKIEIKLSKTYTPSLNNEERLKNYLQKKNERQPIPNR